VANPLYLLTCPNCGGGLEPHAGHPDSAPWLCARCHLGFWVSELSAVARVRYRPRFRDYGVGKESIALRAACLAERDAARERGTSCLEEHIGLLSHDHLQFMCDRFPLSEAFRRRIQAAVQ